MLQDNTKQKSLNRRFLLILGAAAFVCFLALGSMLIFWDRFGLSQTQRWAFGGIMIIYGVIRFARLLRKDKDEE